ncbi:MAG: transcriptional repressor [Candidatus Omnitrophica bacterium]|nr:transcriptional repressor [Candidatus Omnitrophota bacterium]
MKKNKSAGDPVGIFREYCRSRRMRFTPERQVIIEEAYRRHGHFDVDALFAVIRKRRPELKIARASVYRAMPVLAGAGLVREAFSDNHRTLYEHTLGHNHHDHLKCVRCGQVAEFYADEIDRAQSKLCEARGFEMLWHVHVISGFCSRCRSKKKVKTNS